MPTALLMLLLVGAPCVFADALPWTQADYKARKLFLTARLSLVVDANLPAETAASWPPPFKGDAVVPSGESLAQITLRSELGGATKETRLFLDPVNGAALRRQQHDLGSSPDFKDLRFTRTGIARTRAEPLDGEVDLDPEDWGQVRRQFRAFPATADDITVSDSAALPFLLASRRWKGPGDSLDIIVFEDRNFVRIQVTARQWLDTEVDYRTSRGKINGQARLLEITLQPVAYGKDTAAVIDLFGLSSDVRMLIDVEQHVAAEILGSVDYFGEVRFVLKRLLEANGKS